MIVPRTCDLGGFEVRRALPSSKKRMVAPFIFWDQMGPSQFLTGQGIDVRPHPHIGMATSKLEADAARATNTRFLRCCFKPLPETNEVIATLGSVKRGQDAYQ